MNVAAIGGARIGDFARVQHHSAGRGVGGTDALGHRQIAVCRQVGRAACQRNGVAHRQVTARASDAGRDTARARNVVRNAGVGSAHIAQQGVVAECDGPRAQGADAAAVTHLQSTATHCGGAAIAVISGQRGRACARLRQSAGATDRVAHKQCIGSVENQTGVVHNSACPQGTRGPAVAHLQGAGADRGVARVAVAAREDGGTCARLGQRTRPADGVGYRLCVAAVEDQRGVVDDAPCPQISRCAAIAHLQNTIADRGRSGVCVVARKNLRPCTYFG